jgi:predicted DsbA family dithiol-disulfide isomerase
MSHIRIDYYAEITCPWCVIGHYRLDKVLAGRFTGLSVDIIHHPVFLIPDCRPEGVPIAELALSRHGIADESLLWARPEAEARASGLDLVLSRQRFAYPTQGAHTLIRLARERGTQHRFAGAVYAAYFHEARNIADPDVLADIAAQYGFDRAEARVLSQEPVEREITARQAVNARAQGIKSVPQFVFAGHIALNGGRGEDELALAIEQAVQSVTVLQS